jgi:hypothetical protein
MRVLQGHELPISPDFSRWIQRSLAVGPYRQPKLRFGEIGPKSFFVTLCIAFRVAHNAATPRKNDCRLVSRGFIQQQPDDLAIPLATTFVS